MGAGGLSAVCDTGPLLHLAEIDRLPLLGLFEDLHIPAGVRLEATQGDRLCLHQVAKLKNIRHHNLDQTKLQVFIQSHRIEQLHVGELECLFLCKEIGVSLLLTDDLAVREAAKRLRLTPLGSLGILVRACRTGLISFAEAEQSLFDLFEVSSLFVTKAIVELAVQQLREHLGC